MTPLHLLTLAAPPPPLSPPPSPPPPPAAPAAPVGFIVWIVIFALLLHQLGVVSDEARARGEAARGSLAGVLAGDAVAAVEADAVAVVAHALIVAVVRAAPGVVDLEVDQVGA